MHSTSRMVTLAAGALVLGVRAHAAVVAAPGFAVRSYPTPDTVQGGVVRQGNAIFVGQGTFGSSGESIVRLEGAKATTIATGFSSLGGFDLDGTTLYVLDNCFGADFGCGSPTTGDTLYAVANAPSRTTAVTASGSEVLPSGTFAAPLDVLVVPGSVLVSDAVGVGAGRVAKVVGTTVTNLVTGLDFLGGLASDGVTLFVANVDGSFVGSVRKYTLAGAPLGTLIGGLSGSYGVAREGGNVLVTGGFTGDFSSSTVIAVNGAGVATERAHGFAFSSDVSYDAARGAAFVLDFGVTTVTAVCADANADGLCDADCAAPGSVVKPRLKIGRQITPPGDDTLSFKGEVTIAVPLQPDVNGLKVLVDDADGRVIVDVGVPGGAYDPVTRTGWRSRRAGLSWSYRNPGGVVGITTIKLNMANPPSNVLKFRVSGKRGAYDATGATLPVHAVLALSNAGGGCGRATFPGPAPVCTFVAGNTLNCK